MKKHLRDYELKNLKYYIEGKETNRLAIQAAVVFVSGSIIMTLMIILISSLIYYYREEIDNSAYTGFIVMGLLGFILIVRVVRKMILNR